jgi:histidyl-tRNA synthetase
VGERELKGEKVGLRNLKSGEQREVPLGLLVEEIRRA